MQFDQQQTIGFQAAQLSRLIALRWREALAPLGLMPAQAAASSRSASGGLTQKALVKRLEVEQPGVARTSAGSKRRAGSSARRAAGGPRAAPQRPGGDHRARAERIAAEIDRLTLSELSRAERTNLIDALEELITGLKALPS